MTKAWYVQFFRKVSVLEDINDDTCKCVLSWTLRVKTQRWQKDALDNIKEAKDFEGIMQNMQRQDNDT